MRTNCFLEWLWFAVRQGISSTTSLLKRRSYGRCGSRVVMDPLRTSSGRGDSIRQFVRGVSL